MIKRDIYLQQLIDYMWDGQIKVITGIRRCGKSYLLHYIFNDYLKSKGVKEEHIISIELDLARDIQYRNPLVLSDYVRKLVENQNEEYYLFVDEIQMSDQVKNPYNESGKNITFYDALNDLRSISNLDIYVTGSNSQMLSSDILTQFRGRSDEIRVHPLSFKEYYNYVQGDKQSVFEAYAYYGGMPMILSRSNDRAKINYLTSLFSEVYIKDIIERKKIERVDVLEKVVDMLCSSIGSLTNPNNIASQMNNMAKMKVSQNLIASYINCLEDSYLFSQAKRYDIKGKRYIEYPQKYYCEDIGLRNARIGFRQQEMTHIMENIVYNELVIRGYKVDVGVIYSYHVNDKGHNVKVIKEIDFVAQQGNKKVYIQSAFALPNYEKQTSEIEPFLLTKDSFQKIIVRMDVFKSWYDDHGILNVNLIDFLLGDYI